MDVHAPQPSGHGVVVDPNTFSGPPKTRGYTSYGEPFQNFVHSFVTQGLVCKTKSNNIKDEIIFDGTRPVLNDWSKTPSLRPAASSLMAGRAFLPV